MKNGRMLVQEQADTPKGFFITVLTSAVDKDMTVLMSKYAHPVIKTFSPAVPEKDRHYYLVYLENYMLISKTMEILSRP